MSKSWFEQLRERREEYGVSQNRLATAVGISRQYLNEVENGRKTPRSELRALLERELERANPDCPLELLLDYVRIRYPTLDVQHVAETVLRMQFKRLIHEDYAFYGYTEQYLFGDICLMVSPDEDKGVLLELKGRGCRQFESMLLAQHRSWYDFFWDSLAVQGVFKRIDLAINDKGGVLSIPELTWKCEQEECISVFRSFQGHKSGDLLRGERFNEKWGMGNTLYIGSLKSDVYFCIYEKDYEQYKKEGIPIEDAETKNRFEIRLKNDRAYHAVMDILENGDVEKTAFEIINRYIRFVDRVEGQAPASWPVNREWAWFMGQGRGQLRLTTKPEPYTLEKSMAWLGRQVFPTLKAVLTLDILQNTNFVNGGLEQTELTDKHRKMLEQLTLPLDDVILPPLEVYDTNIVRQMDKQG